MSCLSFRPGALHSGDGSGQGDSYSGKLIYYFLLPISLKSQITSSREPSELHQLQHQLYPARVQV